MVSFSCEQCCEVMKKPKLDAHAQRCWGAQFTCIDCNTTFEGTAYRAHTSCVSEEQRYHKSVYKAPKGKGKNQQQQQQQQSKQQAAAAVPAPAPAPAVELEQSSSTTTPAPTPASSNKRAREGESAAATASKASAEKNGDVALTNGGDAEGGEPDKKKKKKDKKQKNKDKKEEDASTTEESKPASLSAFLTSVVEPLLQQKKTPETSGDVSLAEVRRTVLDAAREKGYEVAQVEERLWQGLKVGGKKGKVRVEF